MAVRSGGWRIYEKTSFAEMADFRAANESQASCVYFQGGCRENYAFALHFTSTNDEALGWP